MFKNGGDYMELETKAIHEGWKPGNGEPRQLPIYESTTLDRKSTV